MGFERLNGEWSAADHFQYVDDIAKANAPRRPVIGTIYRSGTSAPEPESSDKTYPLAGVLRSDASPIEERHRPGILFPHP